METVYIVSTTNYTIQGIFKDKSMADTFAENFEDALVEEEILYNEFPKIYRFECTMNRTNGKVIEIKPCSPAVNPMLLLLDGQILYAMGETKAEAQYNAETYLKKLNS